MCFFHDWVHYVRKEPPYYDFEWLAGERLVYFYECKKCKKRKPSYNTYNL